MNTFTTLAICFILAGLGLGAVYIKRSPKKIYIGGLDSFPRDLSDARSNWETWRREHPNASEEEVTEQLYRFNAIYGRQIMETIYQRQ